HDGIDPGLISRTTMGIEGSLAGAGACEKAGSTETAASAATIAEPRARASGCNRLNLENQIACSITCLLLRFCRVAACPTRRFPIPLALTAPLSPFPASDTPWLRASRRRQ